MFGDSQYEEILKQCSKIDCPLATIMFISNKDQGKRKVDNQGDFSKIFGVR